MLKNIWMIHETIRYIHVPKLSISSAKENPPFKQILLEEWSHGGLHPNMG